MIQFRYRTWIFSIMFLLLLFSTSVASAQCTKLLSETYNYSSLNSATTKILCTAQPSSSCSTIVKKAILNAKLDLGEFYKFGITSFIASVQVKLTLHDGYNDPDGTLLTQVTTLNINQDEPEKIFSIDISSYYASTKRVKIEILSYTTTNSIIQNDIRLTAYVDENLGVYVNSANCTSLSSSLNATIYGDKRIFSWTPSCDNIPNYQFQLLRLYPDGNNSSKIDWSQALSFETGTSATSVVLSIMEGTGVYIWRVRPIGNFFEGGTGNSQNWGVWSSHTGYEQGNTINNISSISGSFIFSHLQSDNNINWIYNRSFSENALAGSSIGQTNLGESITFYNGLNSEFQKQRMLAENQTATASATFYDYAGRAAVQTLPAPLLEGNNNHSLRYKHNLILNNSGSFYGPTSFDEDANYLNPLAIRQNASDVESYYSDNGLNAGVGSTDGYPYTRTLFQKDGSSRPKEQSMPGETHRIKTTDSHTNKISYSSVTESELLYVFGNEAPIANSVQKEITVDANNVISVSYISQEGKVLATCLSSTGIGNNPLLNDLSSNGNGFTVTEVLKNESNINNGAKVIRKYSFQEPTSINFSYSLDPEQLNDLCTSTCKTCDYKIEFALVNIENGIKVRSFSKLVVPQNCTYQGWDTTFSSGTLDPGDYQIEKRIYSNNMNPGANPPESFLEDLLANVESDYLTKFENATASLTSALNNNTLASWYVNNGININEIGAENEYVKLSLGCDEQVSVPVMLCYSRPCDPNPDFEGYFHDYYFKSHPEFLNSTNNDYYYLRAVGYRSEYQPGQLNTMISKMLSNNYDCERLWACWESLVATYDTLINQTNIGLDNSAYSYDIIHNFLLCAGYKIQGITQDPNVAKENAYKLFYYNCGDNPTCESGVSNDPDACINLSYTAEEWRNLFFCVYYNNTPTPGFANGTTSSACNAACDNRFDAIYAEVVQAYHNKLIYVENDSNTLIQNFDGDFVPLGAPRVPATFSISKATIECIVSQLILECKSLCTTATDPNSPDTTLLKQLMLYHLSCAIGNLCVPGLDYNTPTSNFDYCTTTEEPLYDICWGFVPINDITGIASGQNFQIATETLKTCSEIAVDEVRKIMFDQKWRYVEQKKRDFIYKYYTQCKNIENINDELEVRFHLSYHHYTLYYYDRAGRLVKTVPPAGVNMLDVSSLSVKSRSVAPIHTMVTSYEYNSFGQLTKQVTPDAGQTEFYYDLVGRLRFSVNAKQAATSLYSYTKYDALGRIIEVGQSTLSFGMFGTPSSLATNLASGTFPNSNCIEKTITVYSTANSGVYYLGNTNKPQRFLQNRVSYSISDVDGNLSTTNDQVVTSYSYDPHGNVEWIAQDLPNLDRKYVAYEYDLITNKVLLVKYNEGASDNFFHKYKYDSDNRIVEVYTSRDTKIWDRDAKYEYYLHGPLKRVVLGEDNIQGLDYAYTPQGWLKAINNDALSVSKDLGSDGSLASAGENEAKDAFGMTLRYYENDFGKNLVTGTIEQVPDNPLYNGNIGGWTSNEAMPNSYPQRDRLFQQFRYDELNRLVAVNHFANYTDDEVNWSGYSNRYNSTYTYDANGNMLGLTRNGNEVSELSMDNFGNYTYSENKLVSFIEQESDKTSYFDPTQSIQLDMKNDLYTYEYDELGNLTKDEKSNIQNITWNVYGKINFVEKIDHSTLIYTYDATGNRVIKEYFDSPNNKTTITYYVRDASGNIMSTYEKVDSDPIVWKEVPIYGSSRIGVYYPNLEEQTQQLIIQPDATVGIDATINSNNPTSNGWYSAYFHGYAWTQGGNAVNIRSFLKFDLSSYGSIPNITSAYLTLYGNPSATSSTQYLGHSGSNASTLNLVTSSWTETGVTWNNQPSIGSGISIPQITNLNQDYPNINITSWVNGWVANPSTNYGMRLKLDNEVYYTTMTFCSSDNTDATRRPKLVINYKTFGSLSSNGANDIYVRELGKKRYELNDHLGNVHVVVSDRKTGTLITPIKTDYFDSGISSWIGANSSNNIANDKGRLKTTYSGSAISGTGTLVSVNVTNGKTYAWKFKLDLGNTPSAYIYAHSGSNYFVTKHVNESGEYTIQFQSSSTGTVNLKIEAAPATSYQFWIDNSIFAEEGSFEPEIISSQTYYPFGMPMPGRTYNNDQYRFGFNGHENTNEISGTGNHTTAEFWEYDPRLGRRWNLDPIDKPWQSRYHAFSNSPIWKIDPKGDDDTYYDSKGVKTKTIERSRLFEAFFGDRNYIVGKNNKEYKLNQQGLDVINGKFGKFSGFVEDWQTTNRKEGFIARTRDAIKGYDVDKETKLSYILRESQDREGALLNQKTNLSKTKLYAFNDMAYNSNEAGNVVWGAAMNIFGFDPAMTWISAHGGTMILKQRFDEPDEAEAAYNGSAFIWNYAGKNAKIKITKGINISR